jgi:hypothetical protein
MELDFWGEIANHCHVYQFALYTVSRNESLSYTQYPGTKVCPIHSIPERIVFSDASSYDSVSFLEGNILEIVHGMFTEQEKLKRSTRRYLRSLKFIRHSLQNHLNGKLVKSECGTHLSG